MVITFLIAISVMQKIVLLGTSVTNPNFGEFHFESKVTLILVGF